MEYVHIPSGTRVTSDAELPSGLYKPVEQPKKPETKRTTRRPAKSKE